MPRDDSGPIHTQASTPLQETQNSEALEAVSFLTFTFENATQQPIERAVITILRVGRLVAGITTSDDLVLLNSKVVSRQQAEIWDANGDVYIKDTKSQSGTYINAVRMSESGVESRPYKLKSGDVVQFGVDHKSAVDDTQRCVQVRVNLQRKVMLSSVVQAVRATAKAGLPLSMAQHIGDSTMTTSGAGGTIFLSAAD